MAKLLLLPRSILISINLQIEAVKSVIKISSIAAAAVVFVFLLTPQEKIENGRETWRRLVNNPAQACLDYERKFLKDPDSAKLLESRSEKESGVIIKYKAKNSYGAYTVGDEKYCYVSSGVVDEQITQLHRDNEESEKNLARLKAENLCIQRRNQLMREGASYAEAVRKNPDCPIIK